MDDSPVHPPNRSDDDYSGEFDPQADFEEFLREVKRNANQNEMKDESMRGDKGTKKSSWKAYFLSFWRKIKEKKQNSNINGHRLDFHLKKPFSSNNYLGSNPRSGGLLITRSHQSAPSKIPPASKNDEFPYVNFGKLSRSLQDTGAYGPVYRVV